MLWSRAHGQTAQIKEVPDGIDFYFTQARHSQKLVNFIMTMVPCRVKAGGGRVISQDFKNNSAKSRNAISLELVPICKDDIFVLHPRQHSSLGGMGPLCLCVSVGAALRIVDVHNGIANDLRPDAYFRFPRKALASIRHAITYTVIDVEKTGVDFDKYALAEVTVARSSDLGRNDEVSVCMSHLGHILNAGDEVLGYDLARLQSAQQDEGGGEWPKGLSMPDVVLIKKMPTERRSRRRAWKLRSLIKEEEEGAYVSMHKGTPGYGVNDDYEEFLADIESDPAARSNVDLYKDPSMWRIDEDGAVVPGRAAGQEEEGATEEQDADVIAPQSLLDGLVLGEEEEEEAVGRGLADSDEEDASLLAIGNG
jgi:nonsense-mediated mRNA decay protein 3